jgi:hypothetical protein
MKVKMRRTNTKWVAQVSLLRPGCSGRDPFPRRNPGLKSETGPPTQSLKVRSFNTRRLRRR